MNRTPTQISDTVKAGKLYNLMARGQKFYFSAADLPLVVKPSNGIGITYGVGQGDDQGAESEFSWLEITNPNAVDVNFTIWVGYEEFIEKGLVLKQSSIPISEAKCDVIAPNASATPSTLAAAGTATFSGAVPNATYGSRKAIVFTNLDATNTNPLYVLDNSGNLIDQVLPITTKIYFLSGAIKLNNPNGGGVQYTVGEFWNRA